MAKRLIYHQKTLARLCLGPTRRDHRYRKRNTNRDRGRNRRRKAKRAWKTWCLRVSARHLAGTYGYHDLRKYSVSPTVVSITTTTTRGV